MRRTIHAKEVSGGRRQRQYSLRLICWIAVVFLSLFGQFSMAAARDHSSGCSSMVSLASTAAEASVNIPVERRMVKKQQMRWIERGANLLLQVRVALANDDLSEHLACQPPLQRRQTIISPFVPLPLFQRAA
ncbi:hypothetical protein [Pseudogemmobacter bohemicus]|uniref:hypothetical protein n=1 Tax=Pseudogemmobacter bohemicus TaxID=2250708 RepID=UPI000DD4B64A|nr:hypothetical protein [Pseudogemmobacter bohemicus]